ncbi:MAG: hypothetical protein MRZ79_19495 [Bacteroidia bacterium]|nr:hypothetical protein [Bacteroidia bacterium]
MKNILLLTLSIFFCLSSFAQFTLDNMIGKEGEKYDYFIEKGLKRYLIKSGKRVVVNEGFGATIDTIYWDNWGFREGIYMYDKKKALKGKKGLQPKTIQILDGANMYSFTPKDMVYTRINNPLPKTAADMDGKDFIKNEEKMVEQWFGGENLGTEQVDGRICTKYKALGGISWVYKGLAYKGEAKFMGVKSSFKVSMIQEDIRVAESKVVMPKEAISVLENARRN